MNFDINLIIVPLTLVFLLLWLLDKLLWKQGSATKQHEKALKTAESSLQTNKTELANAMKAQQITGDIDAFVPSDEMDQSVKSAHQAYQNSRTQWATLQGNPPSSNFLVRWAYEFLPVLLVIVLVRSFVVEPFNIPSSSMVPTLYTGDFILVDKTAYGLRLPLLHTKIVETGSPERGDVAVFREPREEKLYFVKRIVGLPGDEISFDNGVLSVNGQAVQTTPTTYQMSEHNINYLTPQIIGNQAISNEERQAIGQAEEPHARYFQEKLGNHSYLVRYLTGADFVAQHARFLQENSPEVLTSAGSKWRITVPEGQYFALGDNRDRSEDGRVWGFVPEANLSGKATYIWMSKEPGLKLPSFSRVGAID